MAIYVVSVNQQIEQVVMDLQNMRQKEQKQQKSQPLLFNIPLYSIRKTNNNPKTTNDGSQPIAQQANMQIKTILPMIADKRSQLFESNKRARLKTEQQKQVNSYGLDTLNTSIHQYKSVIYTEQKGLTARSKLKTVKEKIVEQYKTESVEQKLKSGIPKDQQFTLGGRMSSDSRKIIINSNPPKQMHSQPSFVEESIEECKQKFIASIEGLPKSVKAKNEDNLSEPLRYLSAFNPFFHRNNKTTNLCLLKIGRIISLKSCLLYKRGEQQPYFYLILLGKVKLQNGNLLKYCQTGESVNEQIIFSPTEKKICLQKAKVIGKTILLQIEIAQWLKLTTKMLLHGFKNEIRQSQALIKRNYITKNWLRNKAKKQSEK